MHIESKFFDELFYLLILLHSIWQALRSQVSKTADLTKGLLNWKKILGQLCFGFMTEAIFVSVAANAEK